VRTPACLIAVPLLTGAAVGLLLPDFPGYTLALSAAGAAVLSLVAACGSFADRDGLGVLVGVLGGCLLSGISLGATAARAAYSPDLLVWFNAREPALRTDPAHIEGVLREDASAGALGVSVTIDVAREDSGHARGGVRLSLGGVPPASEILKWRAGRTVALPAMLRIPAMYGDPGVPDEVRALARRGIVLVGSVKSAALVEVMAKGSALEAAAGSARAWARSRLVEHVGRWGPQSAAIAAAILIGDRSGLSDDDQRRLQEAGTYHVIAISGGNIAILTALLLLAMRVARIPPRTSAALTIVVLLFYGELTGGGASVSRAVTAAAVYLAGRILDHRGPALNALAMAAVAGVALSPLALFDAGFVLSFGATLGILLAAPRLMPAFARERPRPARRHAPATVGVALAALFVATVSAELALAPVSAAVFSRITFAGLVLNFCAIPLMTIVQGASMLTLAAAPVADHAASAAGYVTHVAAVWLVRSARLVDFAPWLSREVPPPSWMLVAVYYFCCAVCLASSRFVHAGIAGIAVCAAIMLAGPAAFTRDGVPPAAPGSLRVVFLDVGQGDATMVQAPDGRTLLVDTGGLPGSAFDVGERIVAPSVRAFGVRKLDALVITHGDPDHLGGAPATLRRFGPDEVWEGVPVPPHLKLRELAAAADAARIAWRTVQAGDRERDGPLEIRVLHPPLPDWERQRVRNDDSIVLELRMGDVSIVLPGDIGAEGERAVAPALALGPIAIVKAPHHGSASSSTVPFVQAAHPSAVVFSAGRGNRFGHPAPAVVDRYRGAGAVMFRTDEDGAVVLDTDGRTVKISTWGGRRIRLPSTPSP
jgi:competence protein ComEC